MEKGCDRKWRNERITKRERAVFETAEKAPKIKKFSTDQSHVRVQSRKEVSDEKKLLRQVLVSFDFNLLILLIETKKEGNKNLE